MKLELQRIYQGDYTIGHLYLNDEYFCDTLEPKVRETKIKGKTAIPTGTYKIQITHSPKFKRKLPLLLNVPDFKGVRIHNGNSKKDTAGCILVGFNTIKGQLTDSRKTLNRLMEYLSKQDDIEIEIKEKEA